MEFLTIADDVLDHATALQGRLARASADLQGLDARSMALEESIRQRQRALTSAADLCAQAWQAMVRQELGATFEPAATRARQYGDETVNTLTQALQADGAYQDLLLAWVTRCERDLVVVQGTAAVDDAATRAQIETLLGHLNADASKLAQAIDAFATLQKAVTGYSATVATAVSRLKAVLPKYKPELQQAIQRLTNGLDQGVAAVRSAVERLQASFTSNIAGVIPALRHALDDVLSKPVNKVNSMRNSVQQLITDLNNVKSKLEHLVDVLLEDAKTGAGALQLILDIADEVDRIVNHMHHIAQMSL